MESGEGRRISFEQYSVAFRVAAIEAGRDEVFIAACLNYAERLRRRSMPIIYDVAHLAALVGYQPRYVLGAAYSTSSFYRRYAVPKKRGGQRQISEPLPSLKDIQRWILDEVLVRVPLSRYAKAYRGGMSIKDNARFHRRQSKVLTIDLKDFFPSIPRVRVNRIFRRLGYVAPVANVLARLCTLEDSLPQGAPTSPALSNIVCSRLDQRIAGFARKHNLRYSRYADDLTLSGEFQPGDVIGFIRKAVGAENLSIHPDKIRVMEGHQRQSVTGIVVNSHLQAPRALRRDLRQALFFIRRRGLDAHLDHIGERRGHYVEHLLGLATFVLFVNPSDQEAQSWVRTLKELQA